MILEDLEYIFRNQIQEGSDKLYFGLSDGDAAPVIERHAANDIIGLIPLLSAFHYIGVVGRIPRFAK